MQQMKNGWKNSMKCGRLSQSEIRIYLTEKKSAGRYVLLAHTFSLGRGVAVHKSAEDAL